jgi:triosephosphate isomerase
MRVPLIVGNWKMNGSLARAGELASAVAAGSADVAGVEVAVCPPFVYLPRVAQALAGSSVWLGAQNVADQDQGAFTGEVAGDMLIDVGCRFVIVGHSERRTHYGESDALVAARYAAARRHGLTPILCVGETLAERESERTENVLRRQIEAVLGEDGDDAFAGGVIAYEPVWAIGTGRSATPEMAQQAHAFIRDVVADCDADSARSLRLLYGGSMKPDSAPALLAMPDVDGGLIGGASLDAEAFTAIVGAAATV